MIDRIAKELDIKFLQRKFGAEVGEGRMSGEPVLLAKPQKYMNLSGEVVSPLAGYYKCSLTDLIVIHDDMDLDLGRIKFSLGSGDGGHNGIRSIIGSLGSAEFVRVRVGIGRPEESIDSADYVLSRFEKEEVDTVRDVVEIAAKAVESLVLKGLAFAQQEYH